MNAQTTLSAKGQVVIPKDVRDRLRLLPGQKLDVVETPDGVLLRPHIEAETLSFDEATKRIRAIIHYDGPPVTIEEMNETIREEWIKSALRSDCAGD